jgi:hypothetical protein
VNELWLVTRAGDLFLRERGFGPPSTWQRSEPLLDRIG